MDIRSREAALKRRNDELDACQTLYGGEDNIATPSYMQEQEFDTPLLSRQDSVQDVNITSTICVEEYKSGHPTPDKRQMTLETPKLTSGKSKVPQNASTVSIELQKLANETKHKAAKKKLNLANVRQGKQNESHIELLRLVESLKSEKQILYDELKATQSAKDHLQTKVLRHEKTEARLNQDLQSTHNRLSELENECSTFRQTCNRLEREQKQREACGKSDSVRIHRQEEQIAKLKNEEKGLKTSCKELKAELANVKESSKKSLNVKDKQIEQLVDGFQKQMQLIDVLRRQKLHLEAAHILQYTEDEFLQTLDWRPHAKADFHICKTKKENTIATNDLPQIVETDDKDNENDNKSNNESSSSEDLDEKPIIEEEETEL